MIEISIIGPKLKDFEKIYLLLEQLWPKERLSRKKLKVVFASFSKKEDFLREGVVRFINMREL